MTKEITPPSVELRKKIDEGPMQEAIEQALSLTEKRQMLLVIWKGTDSGRFATVSFNQGSAWISQYSSLATALDILSRDRESVEQLKLTEDGFGLTETITQWVCEHSDYKLPMLLIVWEPGTSMRFSMYCVNSCEAFELQLYSLVDHIRNLCQFSREESWIQNQIIAQQQSQQINVPKGKQPPKLIIPR